MAPVLFNPITIPDRRKLTRSSIFSGSVKVCQVVPSLRCIASGLVERCLLYYLDLPSSTYSILEPMLKKLTLFQLSHFLSQNPNLKKECDQLFSIHCFNEFKLSQNLCFDNIKQNLFRSKYVSKMNDDELNRLKCVQTWADLYNFLKLEQEYRLKMLNDTIQRNNATSKMNERKTMLIDTAHRSNVYRHHTKSLPKEPAFVSRNLTTKHNTKSVKPKPIAPLMRKCLNLKKQYKLSK